MHLLDPAHQDFEEWRPGVRSRMLVSARNGATALCVFEQFCAPGTGAPTHTHTVEEVLTVLAGTAEIWLDDERRIVSAGRSVLIPPGRSHGFSNAGETVLHMHATLAAPVMELVFETGETRRRWALD